MKHNPKLHERVAALPGHARLHPLQDPSRAQGALELMWDLQQRAGRGLRPAARLAAADRRLARRAGRRAAHPRLPRGPRRAPHKVLTPDTAHGTNPATVTMAGYEVVKVGTDADGGVDLDDLRAKADDDVACLMLTNPNTLGLFDPNIDGDRQDRPRRRRDALLRRREPQRDHGHLAPGRHGLRHRPLQPAQVVHAAARRRRPGLRPDRGLRPHRAVPAAPAGRRAGRDNGAGPTSTSTTTARSRSAACAASRATTASSCAPTPTSCSLGGDGLQEASRDRGAQRQLPAGAAASERASPSTCRSPTTASACTSSSSRARR